MRDAAQSALPGALRESTAFPAHLLPCESTCAINSPPLPNLPKRRNTCPCHQRLALRPSASRVRKEMYDSFGMPIVLHCISPIPAQSFRVHNTRMQVPNDLPP